MLIFKQRQKKKIIKNLSRHYIVFLCAHMDEQEMKNSVVSACMFFAARARPQPPPSQSTDLRRDRHPPQAGGAREPWRGLQPATTLPRQLLCSCRDPRKVFKYFSPYLLCNFTFLSADGNLTPNRRRLWARLS